MNRVDMARRRAHIWLCVALLLLGAFTKSAQVPFHFWLPGAMAAPTPVSSYLHSATMVKAGVYLLARLQPELGGTDLWHTALAVPGALTMLLYLSPLGQNRHRLHSPRDHLVQRDVAWLWVTPLAHQLGKLDYAADQTVQAGDPRRQVVQRIPQLRGSFLDLPLQNLQGQPDVSERGHELVRNHAEKRCLQPIQLR